MMESKEKYTILKWIFLFAALFLFWFYLPTSAFAKVPVVVIDPGHGGDNLGAEPFGDIKEKDLNLKVGLAMYEELSKYDGIEVYLTRDSDIDLSLKERVEIAKEYHADFIFCLHFNMSEHHSFFGAECFIPSQGELYAKAKSFSLIEMESLTGLGLADRGIKTKLKSDGVSDYYGIIRNASAYQIPSVIIEHCHLDHVNDSPYWDTDEWLTFYGKLDAEAVAKYFGLSSALLGADYSDYERMEIDIPTEQIKPDVTAPSYAHAELLTQNVSENTAEFRLSGMDEESRLLYYTYSFDDFMTESERFLWPKDSSECNVTIDLYDHPEQVTFKLYNLFDLDSATESVSISYPETFSEIEKDSMGQALETEQSTESEQYTEADLLLESNAAKELTFVRYLLIGLLIFLIIALLLCIYRLRRKG